MSLWIEKGIWNPFIFEGVGTTKSYPKGTHLFLQNQTLTDVYLILSGRVRAYLLSPSGEERHLFIVGSNSIIGESNAFSMDTYEYSATASTDIKIIRVPKIKFLNLVKETPGLFEVAFQSISQKQTALLTQTQLMNFSKIEERVIFVLTQLAETFGQYHDGHTIITIPFTHHEISQIVGASRVSVSNIMLNLRDKGVISKSNKQYLIHSSIPKPLIL